MPDPKDGSALNAAQQAWLKQLPNVTLQMPQVQAGPAVKPPLLGGDLHLALPGAPTPAPSAPAPLPRPDLTPRPPAAGPLPLLPAGPVPATPLPAPPPAAAGNDGMSLDLGRGFSLTAGTEVPPRGPNIGPLPPDDPSLKGALEFKRGPVSVSGEVSADTGGGKQGVLSGKLEF